MTDINYGLTSSEVKLRYIKFGPNIIFKPAKISFFGIAKQEIIEPMILLLFVVGFFYSLWGKLEDALTIFTVIFLLVFAEVWNEYRAKKAIASLEKITAPKTRVLRNGKIIEIDAEKIVPGDFLVLSSGTKISADAKIKKSVGVECNESALTGESFPQDKKRGMMFSPPQSSLAERGSPKSRPPAQIQKSGKSPPKAKRSNRPKLRSSWR